MTYFEGEMTHVDVDLWKKRFWKEPLNEES